MAVGYRHFLDLVENQNLRSTEEIVKTEWQGV